MFHSYDYLVEFSYVMQEQSISQAADMLSISQPALSRHLDLLEQEVGCKLLERTPRGVRATPRGEELLGKALDIRGIGEWIERRRMSASNDLRRIVIGGFFWDTQLLSSFSAAFAPLRDRNASGLRFTPGEELPLWEEALSSERCDLFVTVPELQDPFDIDERFVSTHPRDDPLVILCSPSNPLARKRPLEIADLAGQRLLRGNGNLYSARVGWEAVSRICSEAGIEVEYENVPTDTITDLYSVALGDAAVLVNAHNDLVEKMVICGNCAIPLRGEMMRYYAFHRRGDERVEQLLRNYFTLPTHPEQG